MKVLMITSHSYAGRYWQDIAINFKSRPEELGFVSLDVFDSPKWASENNHVKYLAMENGKPLSPFFLFELFKRIKSFQPDVIQTHLFRAGLLGLFFGRLLRVPVVVTRHHIDEHILAGSRIHCFLDRASIRFADAVIVRSRAAKNWLVKKEGGDATKITIVNQGFDFELLSPTNDQIVVAREDLCLSESDFNILCIARYSQTKGQEYLAGAVSRLVGEIPNLRLTFVGPGEPDWLQKVITNLGIENITRISLSREDIPACLASADLVVHPSLVDSFSQLLIEVQAVATPVIATDIAAASEQVLDGISGLIVPPRDENAIASAIKKLYFDPSLRQRMGREGSKWVRINYQVSKMVDQDLLVLRSVL